MQPISVLTRRFVDDWKTRGPLGALKRVAESASWKLYPPRRRFAQALEHERDLAHDFDRVHGVETASEISLAEAGISQSEVARGNGLYRGIWAGLFHRAMSAVTFDLRRFTFVDYGSGMGKAMLLASDYPFRSIRGVEYSPPLHAISERNFGAFRSERRRCGDLRAICADAGDYEPPPEPLVCFFFNPFDDVTTRQVLARLRDSAQRHPRPIYLLYVNVRSIRERSAVFTRTPGIDVLVKERHLLLMRLS